MPEDKAKRAARQKKYNALPLQKKNRATRNAARAKMMKAGRVKKGDGKDVDHKNGMSNSSKNLRVMSVKKNRSRNNNKGK